MVTTKINIDLAKKTTAPVVYAMQNDSDSRVVEAHLFVNGLPFDIGEASLSVLFQKPDGKGGWYDKLPDESNAIEAKDGNVVSAILAPQVLNVAGVVIAAIRVDFADGGILSTFPFKIFVEKDPSFGGVESNDYFNVSNWAEVNEEISNIKESLSNALVLDEHDRFYAGGKELVVGALEIDPGLDTVGIILNVEVPEPSEGEKRPTGALSFYDSSYDRSVILRNIADGELDSDAATVGQLKEAVEGIEVEDGFSPTATVEETAEGATITITDKNGTTTATVKNGSGSADVSRFGVPYESAEAVYDISAAQDGSLKMYIFSNATGLYDAVVRGTGAMADFEFDWVNGKHLSDYADYVPKIARLHIEEGVATIGKAFMCWAMELRDLTFVNSKAVTKLGAYSFLNTPITGAFDFSGLTQSGLGSAFQGCPYITELVLSDSITSFVAMEFKGNVSLKRVAGLGGITSIGKVAFSYCCNLEQLDGLVPANVALETGAFRLCNTYATINGVTIRDIDLAEWESVGKDAVPKQDLGAYWDTLMDTHAEQGKDFQFDKIATGDQIVFDKTPMCRNADGTVKYFSEGCALFSMYHSYNCLFQNKQYPNIYEWYNNLVLRKSFTVTEEMATKWGSSFCSTIGKQVGDTVTALDFPNIVGEYGNAWAVKEAHGWTEVERTQTSNPTASKQFIISEIAENHRPVIIWIAAQSSNESGMTYDHAVVIVGYKSEWNENTFVKDSFLVVDSNNFYDIPVWLSYEDIFGTECRVLNMDYGNYSLSDEEMRITMGYLEQFAENTIGEIYNKGVADGHRIVTGSFTPETDISTLTLDIEAGAKVVEIVPTTQPTLTPDDWSKVPYRYVYATEAFGDSEYSGSNGKDALFLYYDPSKKQADTAFATCDTTNGFTLTHASAFVFEAGITYNWTAHYWND